METTRQRDAGAPRLKHPKIWAGHRGVLIFVRPKSLGWFMESESIPHKSIRIQRKHGMLIRFPPCQTRTEAQDAGHVVAKGSILSAPIIFPALEFVF